MLFSFLVSKMSAPSQSQFFIVIDFIYFASTSTKFHTQTHFNTIHTYTQKKTLQFCIVEKKKHTKTDQIVYVFYAPITCSFIQKKFERFDQFFFSFDFEKYNIYYERLQNIAVQYTYVKIVVLTKKNSSHFISTNYGKGFFSSF